MSESELHTPTHKTSGQSPTINENNSVMQLDLFRLTTDKVLF